MVTYVLFEKYKTLNHALEVVSKLTALLDQFAHKKVLKVRFRGCF